MATPRFKVIRVPEPSADQSAPHASEIIPLINVEHYSSPSPPAPPTPVSLSAINERKSTSQRSSGLFRNILRRKSLETRRRASVATATTPSTSHPTDMQSSPKSPLSSSLNAMPKIETKPMALLSDGSTLGKHDVDDSDPYLTIQSNSYDTTMTRPTNKFLQELRSKRRELLDKSQNVSIDQRIALHRRQHQRPILRAQDIFAVHFELNDEFDEPPLNQDHLFTEEAQEKIRNEIFAELNRQRRKQYHKQHRHLLLARSLLMFMTALFAFMSMTLIYVVLDLYERAHYLATKLPDNEFVSIINDRARITF